MVPHWTTRYGELSAREASNNVSLARKGKFTREANDEGRRSQGEDHYSRGRVMSDNTGRTQKIAKINLISWF